MKIVLIDDEPLAITVMENLLKSHPEVEILGTFNSTQGLADKLEHLKPDVVFTDIQMPGETGLEFIKKQFPMPYAVVFTTAYADYAAEAFEFEALDYLVKPIAPDRLNKALKRIEEYIALKAGNTEVAETQDDYVYVKVDGEFQKILYKDILYVEAFADYVKIWTAPDKRVVTLQTMRNMELGLPSDRFIRVHRSFIIAIDKIKSIQNTSVHLIGAIDVPVGKNYKDSINLLLQKNRLQG
jgi:DNA-binding LytR/AlgR family response regulator